MKNTVISTTAAVALAMTMGMSGASATNEGKVCPELSTGHIAPPNDSETVTWTIPQEETGKIILGYCVKAGSANQEDGGPVEMEVDPALELTSIDIFHPTGKDISHYSIYYGIPSDGPVTDEPPTDEEPPTEEEPPAEEPPVEEEPPTETPIEEPVEETPVEEVPEEETPEIVTETEVNTNVEVENTTVQNRTVVETTTAVPTTATESKNTGLNVQTAVPAQLANTGVNQTATLVAGALLLLVGSGAVVLARRK